MTTATTIFSFFFFCIFISHFCVYSFCQMTASVSRDTWRPEADEEFEDSEGNVFDRKTYEDLAKQGLL